MKTQISKLLLAVLLIITLSCQDEKITSENAAKALSTENPITIKPYRITAEDNVLAFESIAYYQSIVDSKDSTDIEKLILSIQNSDFNSFGKLNPRSKLFNDKFMETILDKNQIVKIDKWFIRVNPETELVYVAASETERAYELVAKEERTNANVQVFSTGDDVLELLNEGTSSNGRTLLCSESGIGSYLAYTNTMSIYSTSWTFNGLVRFSKYGIYYSLKAEAGSNVSGIFKIYIELEPVYYHARCGMTNGEYNVSNYQSGPAYYTYHKYQSYQGSKNLNKVYFRGRIKAVYASPSSGTFTQYTSWAQIRVNY